MQYEQLQGGDGVPEHRNGKLTPMHIKELSKYNRLFGTRLNPWGTYNTCEMVATTAIKTSKNEKSPVSSGDVFEGNTALPLLCTVYTLFLLFSFISFTDTHKTYPSVPHLPDKAHVPRDSIYSTDCT